jgi:hypothetical protein
VWAGRQLYNPRSEKGAGKFATLLHQPSVGSRSITIVPAVDVHYGRCRQLFRVDVIKGRHRNGIDDTAEL